MSWARPPRTTLPARGGQALGPLGFGGAPLGNLYRAVDEETACATVDAAWECGIRFFDTAPHYGLGLSERRLGAALRRYPRDEYVLCTKVGRLLEPRSGYRLGEQDAEGFDVPADTSRIRDYSRDGILRSIEDSLDRLGTDRLDIVLVHDPDDHEAQAAAESFPALTALRGEGVIRSVGVGTTQTAMPTRLITRTDLDVVMVAGRYTLLDTSAAKELLPTAEKHGVTVLAAGPLNSGILAADRPSPGAPFHYEPASAAVTERAQHLAEVCRLHGISLRQAALRFPLTHPAVTAVVVGARTPTEIRDNAAAFSVDIPASLWRDLDLQETS